MTAEHETTIAHLDLPTLIGSDRQISWATTIRASRLAALTHEPVTTADADCASCLQITDAKWWIDHRVLPPEAFLAKAREVGTGGGTSQVAHIPIDIA